MSREHLVKGITERLSGNFEHDLFEASLHNLDDSSNKLRFNNFAYSIRELTRHILGEFYQFNLSSCIRQQNSLTAQFVSFSLSNLANIFYPPPIFTIINLCLL